MGLDLQEIYWGSEEGEGAGGSRESCQFSVLLPVTAPEGRREVWVEGSQTAVQF